MVFCWVQVYQNELSGDLFPSVSSFGADNDDSGLCTSDYKNSDTFIYYIRTHFSWICVFYCFLNRFIPYLDIMFWMNVLHFPLRIVILLVGGMNVANHVMPHFNQGWGWGGGGGGGGRKVSCHCCRVRIWMLCWINDVFFLGETLNKRSISPV